MKRVLWTTLISLSWCLGCAGPSLEFPEWTIPVPEVMPVHEYAAVAMDERRHTLFDGQ